MDKLLSIVDDEANASWNQFFLNTEMVRALLAEGPGNVLEVLTKGRTVTAWLWTTTRAAVTIESLTGEALVAARNTWIAFGIALRWLLRWILAQCN